VKFGVLTQSEAQTEGGEREKVAEWWRKSDEELHILYTSPNIRVIKWMSGA
jgi:hypothetical protein